MNIYLELVLTTFNNLGIQPKSIKIKKTLTLGWWNQKFKNANFQVLGLVAAVVLFIFFMHAVKQLSCVSIQVCNTHFSQFNQQLMDKIKSMLYYSCSIAVLPKSMPQYGSKVGWNFSSLDKGKISGKMSCWYRGLSLQGSSLKKKCGENDTKLVNQKSLTCRMNVGLNPSCQLQTTCT